MNWKRFSPTDSEGRSNNSVAGYPWGFSKCTYDKKCKSKKAADWAEAAKWWAKQWADIFKAEQALDIM